MHLIIAKDPEERRRAFKTEDKPLFFAPEAFDAFFQELETMPFLTKTKTLVLEEIDQLPKEGQEKLLDYLKKPNPWIVLHCTASSLPANSKLVKSAEHVTRIKQEKAWEKEKRLAQWVVDEAKTGNVEIALPTAQAFVKGVDPQLLQTELDKLICYVGDKKQITPADIHAISTPMHHETLWQLGDAIFARRTAIALQIGRRLLHDGLSLFPLIANLRSQFHTMQNVLKTHSEGGKQAVLTAYPYLKGGLLDKKIAAATSYGTTRLNRALLNLFEIELKAKNSAIHPELLLEILIAKVSNDSLSTT